MAEQDLASLILEAAETVGIDRQAAERLVQQLCAEAGGLTHYLPVGSRFSREDRNHQIRRAYANGQRYAKIAAEFGLSEGRIRQIVSRA